MATIRQKMAFKKVVEGSTLTQAMKDVKYAESTSKRTNKLTRTKGWQELLDNHLPDRLLAQKHREGLDAGKRVFKNNNQTGEIEDMGVEPDFATRHKYLETAYKIKNKMPKETPLTAVQINFNDDKEKFS